MNIFTLTIDSLRSSNANLVLTYAETTPDPLTVKYRMFDRMYKADGNYEYDINEAKIVGA